MKNQIIKKTLACLSFVPLLFPIISIFFVFGHIKLQNPKSGWFSNIGEASISKKSIKDDNSLFLVLSNRESLSFKDYSVTDFGINDGAAIFDLTSGYKSLVEDSNYKSLDSFKRIFKVSFFSKKSCEKYYENNNKPHFIEHVERCSGANGCFYSTYPSEKYNGSSQYGSQYYLDIINAPQAWDIETGSSSVVIGMIDTGVRAQHSELSNGQISSTLSGTFNGTNNLPTSDLNGHGTFNAGIIGATTNNNSGMAGICWNISIASLRADNPYNCFDEERVEDVVSALNYATTNGIKIVNFSGGFYVEYLTLKQAIMNFGGLLIVACGNDHSNLNTSPTYPSNWNLHNVLSVGASDQVNDKASFSNYSSTYVDLFAPGVNICSLSNSYPYYKTDNGTSYSAPMVSAVAGLLLSKYPNMDTRSIKESIFDNVAPSSFLTNYCKSGGVLDAYAALTNPHIHSHTDHFVYSNATKHKAYCDCGDYIMQAHMWDFGNTWMIGSRTYGTCFHCGEGFPLT